MRINTLLSLLIVASACLASAQLDGVRNWPHPNYDPQQSRFQPDQGLQVALCGIAQNRNPFSTRAVQTVVFNGVQYYSKSQTSSVFAFNLTGQNTAWRVPDLVQAVLKDEHTGSNLTSSIFVALVSDPPFDNFLLTYFTVGSDANTTTQEVVALLNLTNGEVAFKANTTTSSKSKALGIAIHRDLSLVLLTSATSLSALPLPFNNASIGSFDDFHTQWTITWNGTADNNVTAPLVLENSARLAFFVGVDDTLSILKANSGEVEKSYNLAQYKVEKLVFGMDSNIAIAIEGDSGLLINYETHLITEIDYTPLAVASNASEFIGFGSKNGEPHIFRVFAAGANDTITWEVPINVTSPVAASVDAMGIIYVVGAGGDFPLVALTLKNGTLLWQLKVPTDATSVESPIIASTTVNDTFLLVDTSSGQYSFSPSCSGICQSDNFCYCEPSKHTYGPSCTTFCTTNSTCSGHGTCKYDGSCECDSGYFLSDCSVRCMHDKDCFNGTCQDDGTCECLENYYSQKCNQYCFADETCHGNGTCDVDGNCSCTVGGWFESRIHVPPYCLEGTNFAMVGIILAIIGIGGMCIGLCLCCFCEKSRKEAPKNPAKLSLLKHKH